MLFAALFARSAVKVQEQLSAVRIDQWLHGIVFQWRWWFLLFIFFISAFIWWRTLDKSRLREIVLYVSLIIILTLVLDEIGEEMTLWDYPYDLIPLFPPLSAIDLACLPFIYSLIFQRFRTWKSFVIATIIMSGIFCFILEPLFIRIGIYQMLVWESYYGFPIYIMMAVICKILVKRICRKSVTS
ncbi:MAG: hypothetical protein K0R50_557 [Eubacterium sp.]|jgi:hypothetical protein|nr:hypothetical protein [Eubacterium sp.]